MTAMALASVAGAGVGIGGDIIADHQAEERARQERSELRDQLAEGKERARLAQQAAGRSMNRMSRLEQGGGLPIATEPFHPPAPLPTEPLPPLPRTDAGGDDDGGGMDLTTVGLVVGGAIVLVLMLTSGGGDDGDD